MKQPAPGSQHHEESVLLHLSKREESGPEQKGLSGEADEAHVQHVRHGGL